MFKPEFSYTHTIVKNLMDIEGAKEVIENSPIPPIWQSRLQKDALIRQAHHTTRRALRDKIVQAALTKRQFKILTYIQEYGRITNQEVQQIANLSHETAHKELSTLIQSGLLNKKGKARGTYYVLVDDF